MRLKRNVEHLTAGLRALALLMLLPTVTHAGGFALNEFGARANAMGGAMIALADDASAVAYNPAGITQLPGTSVMFGVTAIAPTADVQTGNKSKTTLQTNIYAPPHAYLVHQLSDKAWFGIGEFTRFGLGTQYGYDWGGATKPTGPNSAPTPSPPTWPSSSRTASPWRWALKSSTAPRTCAATPCPTRTCA